MNKIILVIGSVTPAHYQSLRLEFLRKGHKPKIVRIDANMLLELLDARDMEAVKTYLEDQGVNQKETAAIIFGDDYYDRYFYEDNEHNIHGFTLGRLLRSGMYRTYGSRRFMRI